MKILLITDGITPFVMGGMQRHSFNLWRSLIEVGHEVDLVHLTQDAPISDQDVRGLLPQGLKAGKIHCVSFEDAGKLPGHYVRASKGYSKSCYRVVKPDLPSYDFIYAKGFTAFHIIKRKEELGIEAPIITMLHGYEMFQDNSGIVQSIKKGILRPIARKVMKGSDILISYGGRITDLLLGLGVPPEKIMENHGGIGSEWLRAETKKVGTKPKFLFVGRNEKRKGADELIQALDGIEAPITIGFLGPWENIELPQRHEVSFFGSMSDPKEIMEVYDQHDILLCPSHSEGMPNVIMEAMGRGLAVIATDVGASLLLVDGSNGALIKPKDVDELMGEIRRMSALPSEEIEQLQAASREKIESFVWPEPARLLLKSLAT